MDRIALLLLFVISLPITAEAKIGTGEPRIWLGERMSYGAAVAKLHDCETTHGDVGCTIDLKAAIEAVSRWNNCLDDILLEHKVNLRWPDPAETNAFVAQMHFRAQLVEDLMWQGGYVNQLIDACLPGQTVVFP